MDKTVREAVEVLRNGGIILYPTDTIWGIGCDATNPDAVAKVYSLKQREDTKSMLVLVGTPNDLNIYVDQVPEIAWDLVEMADKPLSIIYPNAKNLAINLIAADGSIGIRVIKHPFCEKLIRALRKPIVSTSANISGTPSPAGFHNIDSKIIKGVDYIVPEELDKGRGSAPSGIIQIGVKGEIKVIRE